MKQKLQETCMDEQGAPEEIQKEARTDDLGGI